MPNSTDKLIFQQEVHATPAEVYRAFTNSSALREWMSDFATTDPKPGGRLYMWWNSGYYTCGEYISLEKEKHITFKWFGKQEPESTQVDISFTPKNGGTLIKIVHSGVGSDEAWKDVVQEYEKGWNNGLENLASVLDTGKDLRFTRRPMLGIGVNDFNKDIAQQLRIPVTEGIRIDSALPGMGAEAAGLRKDDVIIGMAGKPVTDFTSLTNALSGHYAGDMIDVTFYRGSEKKSVEMNLSGRPIPDIPETGTALSKATRTIYEDVLNQLKDFLDSVSEEEASFKPSPEEWSVNETVAHLIHGERGWHTFIEDLIGGNESWYDDYGGNVQARVEATVEVYPSKQELLNEFERSVEEKLALLANLPDEVINRKGSYWRLGYNVLQSPYHFNGHMEQMQSAVELARKQ